MTSLVALCIDELSMRNPELVGLAGEHFGAQSWLRLFSSGQDMRTFVRQDRQVDEAWVVSCDDVEPINLAAALKRDRQDMRVCLISFQGTGSLHSRASAAQLDATLTQQAFVARYTAFKRTRAAMVAPRSESSVDVLSIADVEKDLVLEEPIVSLSAKNASASQPLGFPARSDASAHALLLPVVSGSGGAGKSAVAALAAFLSQSYGLNTLLLDFDLQFGDMRAMAGVPDALGVDEVLANPARATQLHSSGAVPAVLGAPRFIEDAEALAKQAPSLLDALGGMFDVIVANTGASWAEQHAVLLERCSKALFLVDQRVSSIAACKRALELCARCGIAQNPFVFAVNFCTKGAPLTSIDVSCALRGAQVFELADGGSEVDELLSEGHPLELLEADNPFVQSLGDLLGALLPLPELPEPSGGVLPRGGLFGRRGRRRKRGLL